MMQMGFFDLSDRFARMDAKKDPLLEIDAVVPWEEFRPALERIWRRPIDAVLMFKALVLSALYNLSDDQIEYQVRDRLSFMYVWQAIAKQSAERGHPNWRGYIARGGQILDASIVPVPRDENVAIKTGKVPEDWAGKPAK